MYLIPHWRGYKIRTEIIEVDDNGANSHRLTRVPIQEIEAWDAAHDEAGHLRVRNVREVHDGKERD